MPGISTALWILFCLCEYRRPAWPSLVATQMWIIFFVSDGNLYRDLYFNILFPGICLGYFLLVSLLGTRDTNRQVGGNSDTAFGIIPFHYGHSSSGLLGNGGLACQMQFLIDFGLFTRVRKKLFEVANLKRQKPSGKCWALL